MSEGEKFCLSGMVRQAAPGAARREYHCRFVRSGRIRSAGNKPGKMAIEAAALHMAVSRGMFDARAVFVDHAGAWEYPSLQRLVGVTAGAVWNAVEEAVEGCIRLYDTPLGLVVSELLDEVLAEEGRPDVGLSIVFWPEYSEGEGDTRRITGVQHVESVDLVFEPAADGRVLQRLSALYVDQPGAAGESNVVELGGQTMSEQMLVDQPAPAEEKPVEAASEWLQALGSTAAAGMLAASGLPAASRERLASGTYATPAEVTAAIEAERGYLAALQADQVVQLGGPAPRSPRISMGLTGLEQVEKALDALISGTRPEGVAPLTGIREAYMLLSGDYELTGLFHGDRVSLANVTSATMAGLVANALNKRVVNLFSQYPRWWESIVIEEDFSNLQQVKWITLGGVADLPTVNEGAAYTELEWGDQTEVASFVKKGGYLGITLEAIDKDDTRKLQAAPRALAQAAWLTLGKAVAGIFTASSGVGPTLSDSKALFHADHANLGTTALSFAAWTAVRAAMRKQTEVKSGTRLGALAAPKFLLVPPDLEITALQILGSEGQPAQANLNDNPFAQGNEFDARMNAARKRVVVVDLWTDTNDWAAVADPKMYPSIGVGFRYGRTPEVFSVASPTAGLMFTNDTMPVKVRYFFAVGPTDYRGLYKNNVTGG
jgi:hypothetical protein